jgi:hypothetical protein
MRPLKSNLLFSNKLWRRWDKNWLKGRGDWRIYALPSLTIVFSYRPARYELTISRIQTGDRPSNQAGIEPFEEIAAGHVVPAA